jgi:hypothetical protein
MGLILPSIALSSSRARQSVWNRLVSTLLPGSADSIAKKRDLDPALVEQIVRLYVTHPGVTVDGIMTKMGLLGKL